MLVPNLGTQNVEEPNVEFPDVKVELVVKANGEVPNVNFPLEPKPPLIINEQN